MIRGEGKGINMAENISMLQIIDRDNLCKLRSNFIKEN